MYAIFTVVWGVTYGIIYMECLGSYSVVVADSVGGPATLLHKHARHSNYHDAVFLSIEQGA